MNLKKFLSMIMVLSMTAAVFTGCGSSSDSTSDDSAVAGKKGTENNTGEEDSSEGDKEKLTFWDFHTGTEADVIQDMVNAYNQSQDKVNACMPSGILDITSSAKSPAEQYKNVWHQIGGKTCENQRKLWKQAV